MDLLDVIWLLIKYFIKRWLKWFLEKKEERQVAIKKIKEFKRRIEDVKIKLHVPELEKVLQQATNKIADVIKIAEHHKDIKEIAKNSWFQTKPEVIKLALQNNKTLLDKGIDKIVDIKENVVDLTHTIEKKIADIEIKFKKLNVEHNIEKAAELAKKSVQEKVQQAINKVFEVLPQEAKKDVYRSLDIQPNIWIKVSSTWILAMRFYLPEEKKDSDYGRIDYLTKHITKAGNNYYQGTYEHLYFDFCSAVQTRMISKSKTKYAKNPNKNGYYPYWNNGAGNVIWRLFGADKHPMR